MPPPPRPLLGGHRAAPPPPPRPKLLKEILAGSVESIDDMSGGGMNPVWLVTLRGGDKLVVKAEQQFVNGDTGDRMGAFAKGNIKVMNQVMTTASPTSSMEMLEPSERTALNTFAARPISLMKAIQEAEAGRQILIKMKFDPKFFAGSNTPVTGDASMSDADKAKARQVFNGLRNNRVAWQTLGQVAIADNLIGNGDRLSFPDWKVTNFGNLIFSRDGSGNITHALGYDSINPQSFNEKMMWGTNIKDWEVSYGQHIKNKSRFMQAGTSVVGDINQRRMVPLGLTPFGADEGRFLGEGLMIGWDKQANQIGAKVRAGTGIASGLMARAKYLGWVK